MCVPGRSEDSDTTVRLGPGVWPVGCVGCGGVCGEGVLHVLQVFYRYPVRVKQGMVLTMSSSMPSFLLLAITPPHKRYIHPRSSTQAPKGPAQSMVVVPPSRRDGTTVVSPRGPPQDSTPQFSLPPGMEHPPPDRRLTAGDCGRAIKKGETGQRGRWGRWCARCRRCRASPPPVANSHHMDGYTGGKAREGAQAAGGVCVCGKSHHPQDKQGGSTESNLGSSTCPPFRVRVSMLLHIVVARSGSSIGTRLLTSHFNSCDTKFLLYTSPAQLENQPPAMSVGVQAPVPITSSAFLNTTSSASSSVQEVSAPVVRRLKYPLSHI